MDFITILSAPGRRLAKVIRDDLSIQPYDETAHFNQVRMPVRDIFTLHQRLDTLRSKTDSCIIRGSAISRSEAAKVTFDDGQEPLKNGLYRRRLELFPDSPHRWLMLDVDGAQETDFDSWIQANLPEAFHDITYVWHLSSSSGVKPGLRGHLWFWLTNEADSATVREWAKSWNQHLGHRALDTAIYNAVQVHYTADPVVEDEFGLLDLPTERMGIVQGFMGNEVDITFTPVKPPQGPGPSGGSDDVDDDWLLNQAQPLDDIDEDAARAYLARIDNEAGDGLAYDDWLKVGMALKHQFGDAGLELFLEFSQRSPKYDEADAMRRWRSFHTQRRGAATFSSIIYLAGGRIKPETEEEVRATKEEIEAEIDACSDPEVLTGRLVKKIGAAGFSDTLRDILLDRCRQQVKKATGTLLNKSRFTAPLAEEAKKGKTLNELHVEVGLAKMVLDEHFDGGEHLKLIGGNFWKYTRGVWRLADEGIIKKYANDAIQDRMSNPRANDRFCEMLLESDRTDRLGALVDAVVKIIGFEVTEVEDDPLGLLAPVARPVVNCTNGELWFSDDGELEFRQHRARNNLVQQISCAYDEDAECPTWDTAVDRVFKGVQNKQAVIDYWYELMGYMIQPTRSAGEAWMLMKGPGGNGKSFLLDIIQTILGDAATAESLARLAQSPNDHFSSTLVGTLLLVDDDFKAKGVLPDDWMKKLTGQKALVANPKYQRQYKFLCRTMVVILSNGWPSTADSTDGMRRRANVFEVHHTLTDDERDPHHRTTIVTKELPGVLNRLVQGWQRVLRAGGKLRPAAEVLAARDRWLANGSSGARFLTDCIVQTFDPADRLLLKEVWSLYKQWMTTYETGGHQLGRNGLLEQCASFGMRIAGRDGHTHSDYFEGWAINDAARQAMLEADGL